MSSIQLATGSPTEFLTKCLKKSSTEASTESLASIHTSVLIECHDELFTESKEVSIAFMSFHLLVLLSFIFIFFWKPHDATSIITTLVKFFASNNASFKDNLSVKSHTRFIVSESKSQLWI